MLEKDQILDEIITYYLNSNDYNGLPLYQMENYDYKLLCQLLDDGDTKVLSDKDTLNPHINGFDLKVSITKQKNNISTKEKYIMDPRIKTRNKDVLR